MTAPSDRVMTLAGMDIRFDQSGRLGIATLDRAQALNALTLDMARLLDQQLVRWTFDGSVAAVVIRSAGGRAFCAGGDIRALYDAGRRGDDYIREFYRVEYRLNHRIKAFRKPYIALIDGIVMGGGVGLSIHGSHRVATERALFAMPETGIGFFPDVGGSWFLPRCPGAVGTYLGLTGARIGAADMIHCRLATHHVRSSDLAKLTEMLASRDANDAIGQFAADPGSSPLVQRRAEIDRCFSPFDVEQILARLDREGTEWARDTAALLRQKSPTSLKVTVRQLLAGAKLRDFAAAIRMEYRLTQHFMAGHDFYEGVRAAVLDKDQAPRWQPATLAEVSDEAVERYFAPLDEPDLDLADI